MARALLEREAAVAEIEGVLADAGTGKGRALFLLGEAGLGKTSLLALARRKAEGFKVGLGRGGAAEASLPFGILSQALAPLGALELTIRPAVRPSGVDARATAFYSALTALRSAGRVLLTLDDLHWADADSLALLAFLCRRITEQPVAMIGTLRPNPVAAIDLASRMAADGEALIESLAPLSPPAAAALLAAEGGGSVDPETARRAWEVSAGNPLLLKHLAMSWNREGRLPVVRPGDEDRAGLRLLLPRFAGVSTQAFQFARMASVIAVTFRPFEAATLAGCSEKEAATALEELARAGLVRSESSARAEFVHPLFRQLLYEDIPSAARSQYQAAAFRVLAESGAAVNEAADHARAARLSRDPKAIAVLEEAGRLAMAAGALERAREHLQGAIDIAGDQVSASVLLAFGEAALAGGDVPAALAAYRRALSLPALPPQVEVKGHWLLGRALMVAGQQDQGEAELRLAAELAFQVDPSQGVEILLDHATGAWLNSGVRLTRSLAERARRLARDLSPALRRRADVAWAFIALHFGDPSGLSVVEAAAREVEADPVAGLNDMAWSWGVLGTWMIMTRLTERFEDSQHAFEIGYRAAVSAGIPRAQARLAVSHADQLVRLGRLREALDLVARAAEFSELIPTVAQWAAVARADIHFELGDTMACEAACDQAEDIGRRYEGRQPIFWLWLWNIRARLLLDAGEAPQAAALYEHVEGVAAASEIREPCGVPWIWPAIEAHTAADRPVDAKRLLEKLQAEIGELPCRWPRAALAVGRARLAERDHDIDRADGYFREALAHLQQAPLLLAQADALIAYGRFLRIHRHPKEARQYLSRALELAERSGAGRLARVARDELGVAGGRRRRERGGQLTAQETRIALLAAEGLSDRQISRRLSISSRTVDAHLQHIYTKLGMRSRRELIRRSLAIEEEAQAPAEARSTPLAIPLRYVSRDGSDGPAGAERRCPACESGDLRPRQTYCSPACRQAGWRRRHSIPPPPSVKPPKHLVVYECSECERRYLGERRCPDCNLFTKRIGAGDACPHCGEPVAVSDLVP